MKNMPKNLGKEKLSFMADRSLENLLGTLNSLGSFSEETHVFTAQYEGECNMGLTTGTQKGKANFILYEPCSLNRGLDTSAKIFTHISLRRLIWVKTVCFWSIFCMSKD